MHRAQTPAGANRPSGAPQDLHFRCGELLFVTMLAYQSIKEKPARGFSRSSH
jgi:hypothetical protein